MNKIDPDYEGDLVGANDVEQKFRAMLERFETKGCLVEEKQPGEHTVTDGYDRLIGVFFIVY